MKRIIRVISIIFLLILTGGCLKTDSMEDITIYTTSYPIEYITNRLYGEHSTVKSIYPTGVDINKYKITNILIDDYDDNDFYIFNGLTKEKTYVKRMRQNNKKIKIIDVASDISYDHKTEELWLDPSNLLSLANNIQKGFNEYIDAKFLTDEINKNYEDLKNDLTSLEAEYRDELKNTNTNIIVVSDDMFLFLEKYDLDVVSLDKNNENFDKNLVKVHNLINNGMLKYIFVPDTKTKNTTIDSLSIEKMQLNTLSNLTDEQRDNYDYLSLAKENLQILKKQLNSN